MIHVDSLTRDWLAAKHAEFRRDPSLIEKMIFALHLVEQLQISGLDFIFKGGTSLILLLEKPLRFSVDIDIIVAPQITQVELEAYLQKVVQTSQFKEVILDNRRSYKEGIPKAHYKFMYSSAVPTMTKDNEAVQTPDKDILLDVLFADNPYPAMVTKPIITPWVKTDGDPVIVRMPCINSIAGDKLVAYAPCTTGVPYEAKKEREIIKQLFDIGVLFDSIQDAGLLRAAYQTAAQAEILYRPERKIESVDQVLNDTIGTSLIIANFPKYIPENKNKYTELMTGIGQFTHFVFDRKGFSVEDAQVASAKAAYLAAFLLTGQTGLLHRFNREKPPAIAQLLIQHPEYNFLNKRLKYVRKGEALFYWHHTLTLLFPPQAAASVVADSAAN